MEKDRCIALTGGTGLIGSYLLRHLVREGYRSIRASHRKGSRFELVEPVVEKIDWREGEISDTIFLDDFVRGADTVIHAAAMVSYARGDREKMREVNVEGTANVANACLAGNVSKLIHLSSTSTLGKTLDGRPKDEQTEWKKEELSSTYGKTKFRAELEAFRAFAEGLDVRVINPCIVLGSGFWDRTSANLFPKISGGIPFYPKGSTGYVDVRDVAEMIVKVGNEGKAGERYICCGEHISHEKLMRLIAQTIGTTPPRWPLRNWMIPLLVAYFHITGWFGDKGSSVTTQSLSIAQGHTRFDPSKSIEELGMQYRPVEETIREIALQYIHSRERGSDFARLPL